MPPENCDSVAVPAGTEPDVSVSYSASASLDRRVCVGGEGSVEPSSDNYPEPSTVTVREYNELKRTALGDHVPF